MAGSIVPRWLSIALAVLFAALPAHALHIDQTLWGFDGHIVPERFNVFSVLVANPENLPFDGPLKLMPDLAVAGRGVAYAQSIYLAPHTSRWVQFYVQSPEAAARYILSWGPGRNDSYEVEEKVTAGPPASVWLRDLDSPFGATGALKTFPDQLFPTTAAATEGLDAVVLDHVPNWEPARREAFLDWVRLGGSVFLVPGPAGALPAFGYEWHELDFPGEAIRVGAGHVAHLTVTGREINEGYLAGKGYAARTLNKPSQPMVYDLDAVLFRNLSSLTRPKVNWVIINLLMGAYLVVIGPVHNHYRRRFDYRVSILAFLGCVAVFGLALAATGRRGYGESQTVHSLGIARSLGGGRVDLTQWISAFAVTGDRYVLTHRAPANLYALDRGAESGSGAIFNGKDGRLLLDIPLYSARAFTHQAIMTGDDTSVTVEKWETDGPKLRELRLRPGPGFPQQPRALHAIFGGRLYLLTLKDGVVQLTANPAESLDKYFSRDRFVRAGNFPGNGNARQTVDNLEELMPLLEARALGINDVFSANLPPRNAGEMQLLIQSPAPSTFQLQGKGFSREDGWVLYVQDVSKP
jgi:hypothetical protein